METVESIVAGKLCGGGKTNYIDRKWEDYEQRKGIPKPCEVDLLQDEMKKMLHSDGLNSWYDYFVSLNLKPLKANELSQLLRMSQHDAVRKEYLPLWKLYPKPKKSKVSLRNDHLGADVDKYDDLF